MFPLCFCFESCCTKRAVGEPKRFLWATCSEAQGIWFADIGFALILIFVAATRQKPREGAEAATCN